MQLGGRASRSTVLSASGQADFACKAMQIRRSYYSMGRRRSAPGFQRRALTTLASPPSLWRFGSRLHRSFFVPPAGDPRSATDRFRAPVGIPAAPAWHEHDVVLTPGNEARLSTVEVPAIGRQRSNDDPPTALILLQPSVTVSSLAQERVVGCQQGYQYGGDRCLPARDRIPAVPRLVTLQRFPVHERCVVALHDVVKAAW